MNIFWWEVKETISNIGHLICNIFKAIGEGVMDFIIMTFGTIRIVLYRVMCVVLAITTIGFMIGLFLLFLNVRESIVSEIGFMNTKYFTLMIYLCIGHIVAFTICRILHPND